MDQDVFMIVGDEEYSLGTVETILNSKTNREILLALRDAVDRIVFDADSREYITCSIEVR